MHVVLCELSLYFHETRNLKQKRQSLRKIVDRTRNKFNISIAETGHLDSRNRSNIGFAVVSNDTRFLNSVLDKIINFIDSLFLAEITYRNTEFLVYGE